jgi:hypothetical protein
MQELDPETRARALALRDALLEDVTDKTDPRYLELVARIRAREEELGSSENGSGSAKAS